MNMFSPFEPEQLIRGIEIAKTNERELDRGELNILKKKLLQAEQNPDIIRLARGEGRYRIIDEIIADDNIIFNWGMKGQHAFHRQSEFRDFLEPNCMDAAQMKKIVKTFKEAISYRYAKNFSNSRRHIENADSVAENLYRIIDDNESSEENLILIKDWICTILHTAGAAGFKNVSPWVSTTSGDRRYKTAYFFAKGRALPTERAAIRNRRFVIFDTWVNRYEEHHTYERTRYLIEKLRELGLPWYDDTHHEIMLKYAIYPHSLIGYYYFENDNLLHYQVNPHYLRCMNADDSFEIGNYVYIDQSDVSFPANNPYRMIYSRTGPHFNVFDRR